MKKITAIFSITVAAIVFAVAFLPLRAIAGLESPCTYLSDLVSTNPLSSDLASTGDDHHRCIKVALKTTFPNINGAVTATQAELNITDGVTADATEINYLDGATGVTGTGNTVRSASPTLTGTVTGAAANFSGAVTVGTIGGFATTDIARLSQANTFSFTGDSIQRFIGTTSSRLRLRHTGANVDEEIWELQSELGRFRIRAVNDAENTAVEAIEMLRSGTTVDSINLTATAVKVNGSAILSGAHQRVAYFYQNNSAGSCVVSSVSASSGVTSCTRNSAGDYTVTVAAGFTLNPVCTVVRVGDGSATFQATSTTSVSVITLDNTATMARADAAFNMMCMGT